MAAPPAEACGEPSPIHTEPGPSRPSPPVQRRAAERGCPVCLLVRAPAGARQWRRQPPTAPYGPPGRRRPCLRSVPHRALAPAPFGTWQSILEQHRHSQSCTLSSTAQWPFCTHRFFAHRCRAFPVAAAWRPSGPAYMRNPPEPRAALYSPNGRPNPPLANPTLPPAWCAPSRLGTPPTGAPSLHSFLLPTMPNAHTTRLNPIQWCSCSVDSSWVPRYMRAAGGRSAGALGGLPRHSGWAGAGACKRCRRVVSLLRRGGWGWRAKLRPVCVVALARAVAAQHAQSAQILARRLRRTAAGGVGSPEQAEFPARGRCCRGRNGGPLPSANRAAVLLP